MTPKVVTLEAASADERTKALAVAKPDVDANETAGVQVAAFVRRSNSELPNSVVGTVDSMQTDEATGLGVAARVLGSDGEMPTGMVAAVGISSQASDSDGAAPHLSQSDDLSGLALIYKSLYEKDAPFDAAGVKAKDCIERADLDCELGVAEHDAGSPKTTYAKDTPVDAASVKPKGCLERADLDCELEVAEHDAGSPKTKCVTDIADEQADEAVREDMAAQHPLESRIPSLFGCVFVKDGKVGLMSYHFVDSQCCYISFADAGCDEWQLDDGSRPPDFKDVLGITFDPVARIFRGAVSWAPTAFEGHERWELELIFSADISVISGGSLRRFTPAGVLEDSLSYSEDLVYRRAELDASKASLPSPQVLGKREATAATEAALRRRGANDLRAQFSESMVGDAKPESISAQASQSGPDMIDCGNLRQSAGMCLHEHLSSISNVSSTDGSSSGLWFLRPSTGTWLLQLPMISGAKQCMDPPVISEFGFSCNRDLGVSCLGTDAEVDAIMRLASEDSACKQNVDKDDVPVEEVKEVEEEQEEEEQHEEKEEEAQNEDAEDEEEVRRLLIASSGAIETEFESEAVPPPPTWPGREPAAPAGCPPPLPLLQPQRSAPGSPAAMPVFPSAYHLANGTPGRFSEASGANSDSEGALSGSECESSVESRGGLENHPESDGDVAAVMPAQVWDYPLSRSEKQMRLHQLFTEECAAVTTENRKLKRCLCDSLGSGTRPARSSSGSSASVCSAVPQADLFVQGSSRRISGNSLGSVRSNDGELQTSGYRQMEEGQGAIDCQSELADKDCQETRNEGELQRVVPQRKAETTCCSCLAFMRRR